MGGKESNLSSQSSPVQSQTVGLKNQLVLLKFFFIFVCRCKWVLDVAAAVIFTGKSAGHLGNSWSGIGTYTTILQAVDFVIFRAIDAYRDATSVK